MRNWDCCPKGHANKLTGATLHNSPTNKPIGVANVVGRTIVDGHKKKIIGGTVVEGQQCGPPQQSQFLIWPIGNTFCPPCFVLFCFLSYSHLAVYILQTLQMSM